jgi:hypothetical protein
MCWYISAIAVVAGAHNCSIWVDSIIMYYNHERATPETCNKCVCVFIF